MIGLQKDGYRLVGPIEHGRRMVQNGDNMPQIDVPAIFAEIMTCSPDCYQSEVESGSFMMVD
jgi:hypothetical protein